METLLSIDDLEKLLKTEQDVYARYRPGRSVKTLGDQFVEAQLAKGTPLQQIDTAGLDCSFPLDVLAQRMKWTPPQNSLGQGWTECFLKGHDLVDRFSPLYLGDGWEFRLFSHCHEGHHREARLFCVPESQLREQVQGIPTSSTVPGAAVNILGLIGGDGSPRSYLSLLFLARALTSLGLTVPETTFSLLSPVYEIDELVERSFVGRLFGSKKSNTKILEQHGWQISGPIPNSFEPRLIMQQEGAELRFWLYKKRAGERLYEQVALFSPSSYVPDVSVVELGKGPRSIL